MPSPEYAYEVSMLVDTWLLGIRRIDYCPRFGGCARFSSRLARSA